MTPNPTATAPDRLVTHRVPRHVHEPKCTFPRDRERTLHRGDGNEVIASDVPDEIRWRPRRLDRASDRLPHVSDHHVRDREAERVRERLEVVEIDVTDRERFSSLRATLDLVLDRLSSRKPARRISIALAPYDA